jgi:hypothetical protein
MKSKSLGNPPTNGRRAQDVWDLVAWTVVAAAVVEPAIFEADGIALE